MYRQRARDKKFQTFCRTDGLIPAVHTDSAPSYHGYGCDSKIDYILAHRDSCLLHGLKIEDIRMTAHLCKDENPYIISTHDALCFEINFDVTNNDDQVVNNSRVEAVEIV